MNGMWRMLWSPTTSKASTARAQKGSLLDILESLAQLRASPDTTIQVYRRSLLIVTSTVCIQQLRYIQQFEFYDGKFAKSNVQYFYQFCYDRVRHKYVNSLVNFKELVSTRVFIMTPSYAQPQISAFVTIKQKKFKHRVFRWYIHLFSTQMTIKTALSTV